MLVSEYDYVVVGGGTSGCAVAARLSEEKDVTVLLLEAGMDDKSWKLEAPLMAYELQNTDADWKFRSTPQESCNNRRSFWPRGKVLGGCSQLNFMIWVFGWPIDYEKWGFEGWTWKEILPFFKKAETYLGVTRSQRGKDGPIFVSQPREDDAARVWKQGALDAGYRIVEDYNADPREEGFSTVQLNVRAGKRQSSSVAYLKPLLDNGKVRRPNLHIRTKAHVVRIEMDSTPTAKGVHFVSTVDGKNFYVRASREVVLCAGAVQTPQILMLSGVGDKDELTRLGIPCTMPNPNVGQNLQDHLFFPIAFSLKKRLSFRKKDVGLQHLLQYFWSGEGPLTTQGLEGTAFLKTQPDLDAPDLQLHFVKIGGAEKKGSFNVTARNMGLESDLFPKDNPDFIVYVLPTLLHPKSIGEVRLQSKNPFDDPIIEPRYLTHPDDREVLRRGIQIVRKLMKSAAWQEYGAEEMRAPFVEDHLVMGTPEYDDRVIDKLVVTVYHPTSTCAMGTVTDFEGRVLAVKNLRIADISILPSVPGANTMAPAYMVAEKIACEIIKSKNKHHKQH